MKDTTITHNMRLEALARRILLVAEYPDFNRRVKEKYITDILNEATRELVHYRDSTVGLICTDRADVARTLSDLGWASVLFQLDYDYNKGGL